MLFVCRGWTRKKFWHTATADNGSAINWEVIFVTDWCVYRENVLDGERDFFDFFCSEYMIGKGVCGKWRVFAGATSWRGHRVRLGWVGQLSASVGGEVLPIHPDSEDLRDFAPRHLIADLNRESLTSTGGIYYSINELEKERYPWLSPSTSQILRDKIKMHKISRHRCNGIQ